MPFIEHPFPPCSPSDDHIIILLLIFKIIASIVIFYTYECYSGVPVSTLASRYDCKKKFMSQTILP